MTMILFILAILILYIYIIIININHGKSRSLTLIPGYDHFLILTFMYILGIIVLGNSINQPLFWYSKWQCSFSFLSQHVTVFFFRENVQLKTLQYNGNNICELQLLVTVSYSTLCYKLWWHTMFSCKQSLKPIHRFLDKGNLLPDG